MQIQIDREAMIVMRRNERVRRLIALLANDPTPEWARLVPGFPGEYEQPVDGYWIRWRIDDSGSERVIKVTVIE